ncbi:MAG: hypothetical protein O7C73_01245 [Nitrospirae bacterium]|nr:hypothetical protein [Nitrospirota bacterium]
MADREAVLALVGAESAIDWSPNLYLRRSRFLAIGRRDMLCFQIGTASLAVVSWFDDFTRTLALR